jgi:hypothetical protein
MKPCALRRVSTRGIKVYSARDQQIRLRAEGLSLAERADWLIHLQEAERRIIGCFRQPVEAARAIYCRMLRGRARSS